MTTNDTRTLQQITDALTRDQIAALMAEAGAVGDTIAVAMCRRALDGSQRALRSVARMIAARPERLALVEVRS
jgi:hypothetical protein